MVEALKPSGKQDTCDDFQSAQPSLTHRSSTHVGREEMPIVIAGHVDHGKSTIIGRLLAETGTLPLGKKEQIEEACRRSGKPFEYAFLLDALKDEREQGITIDAARCFFKTDRRHYIIIDAPGHVEFLKNMATGASRAEAALLVIDVTEGVRENSIRHGYMLSMLGIKQIAVLINKMDLKSYDQAAFEKVRDEYAAFLQTIDVEARAMLPVSGYHGENLVRPSAKMPWYDGPCVLEVLDSFVNPPPPLDKPFRMPVQGVYRFTRNGDRRRIVAGTVETGRIKVGDTVMFYPSGKTSRIQTIEQFPRQTSAIHEVGPGQATGFTLEEQIYIRRGEVAAMVGAAGPTNASAIRASLFWLGKKPMITGKRYFLKMGTAKVEARLNQVEKVLDASTLRPLEKKDRIDRHDVAECLLSLGDEIAVDVADDLVQTARFVIVDEYEIVGGGLVQEVVAGTGIPDSGVYDSQDQSADTYADHRPVLGQKGQVVWFVGPEEPMKSTIEESVAQELNRAGRAVFRLDHINLRLGLNSDLGNSEEDQIEYWRRVVETAALFQQAGLILLASVNDAFSPSVFLNDKDETQNGIFVHVERKQGLSLKGDPSAFDRLSYSPDVVIDPDALELDASVNQILTHISQKEVDTHR